MTVIVVMGVAGCGKSTIATALAARTGWRLLEGDRFHPPANVAKMAGGTPLTDEDRLPWLRALADAIDSVRAFGGSAVVACSALKRSYRDILIGERADVRLVYLKGQKSLIARRLSARGGHFMPAGLLDSQFATLEEPGADENAITVSIDGTSDAIVDAILRRGVLG